MRHVAVGDVLRVGPYLARPGMSCPAVSRANYGCTAPKGHLVGDIPHIGYGDSVLAIWDDAGHEVTREEHGLGATIDMSDPIERQRAADTAELRERMRNADKIRRAAVTEMIEGD